MVTRGSEIPPEPVEVATLVRGLATGPLEQVWRNDSGGMTFRDGQRYLKWNPSGNGIDLEPERARLDWARRWHPVPEVLELASDDDGQVLVTAALPGENAVTPGWRARPREAVRAIALGLRRLHDRLPVDACPFGVVDWVAGHETLPVDLLVVSHGDSCAPNTIIAADGGLAGHVDVGALGPADRWADLGVATMSIGWNYGPGWEPEFWDAYGVEPDEERISFYRALYHAAS